MGDSALIGSQTMTVVSVILVALVVFISIAILVHSTIGCVSGNCMCCIDSRNHNMVLEITPQAETFEFTSEILTQISIGSTIRSQDVAHLRGSVDLPGQTQQDTDSKQLAGNLEKYQVDNIC